MIKLLSLIRSCAHKHPFWMILCVTLVLMGVTLVLMECSFTPLRPVSPAHIGPYSGEKLLAETLEEIRVEERLTALASAIIVDGKILAIAAVGMRIHGTHNWVNTNDRFLIGSCAKAFTATLAGVLVDQGLLSWDTTVKHLFPKVEMLPEYSQITLGQLLSHRAGLQKNLGDGRNSWSINYGFDEKRGLIPQSLRMQYLEKIVKQPLKYPPGKAVYYSNAGYIVVGAMLEEVSGVSFEQLREERIFRPLGIKSTGYGPPTKLEADNQPWGHYWDESTKTFKKLKDRPPSFMAPAGYLSISMGDWAKFVLAHIDSYPPGQPRLLALDTLMTLHKPLPMEIWDINIGFDTDYAMGWFTKKIGDGRKLIWHGGRGFAFNAVMVVDLTSKNAVLLVTNTEVPHIHPQWHLLQMVNKIKQRYRKKYALPGLL